MSDKKIIIVDFEDSFTYNIASVLFPIESNVTVINHQSFFKDFYKDILQTEDKVAVILGPGPGHPKEFSHYFKIIKMLRAHRKIYLMGICLGHQIVGLMDDLTISDSLVKLHGQTEEVIFQKQRHIVQRYNSLSVFEENIEVMIRYFAHGVSYQFHPESIGTENNLVFFQDLLDFIE